MKLTIIGTGYVGLVSGVCFAEHGFDVTCVDKDRDKIQTLKECKLPFFEPKLFDYLKKNMRYGRLHFTTELEDPIFSSDIIFIAVGTPCDSKTGRANLTNLFSLLKKMAPFLVGYKIIVMKSTIPVGTTIQVGEYLKTLNSKATFDVVANPEFLREGSAIQDFMQPDRIVVGTESTTAKKIMQCLYNPFVLAGVPVIETTPETAELIKYASNAFLATKIAFINQIADLCEKCNGDVRQVAKGIGLDHRIGKEFLNVGPGFGGSCFPKDMQALIHTSNDVGVPLTIVDAALKSNKNRKNEMVNRIISAEGGCIQGKILAVLGLTFKANTDDLRESPSLTIIPELCAAGATIRAYDPRGIPATRELFPNIFYATNAYQAIEGADALLMLTEWEEFTTLDLRQVKNLLKSPLIIDLRNIFSFDEMELHKFIYYSLGNCPFFPSKDEEIENLPYEKESFL